MKKRFNLMKIKFIKKLVNHYQLWKLGRLKKRAADFLARVDRHMENMRWSRKERRRFWRDFIKNGHLREQFVKEISENGEKSKTIK